MRRIGNGLLLFTVLAFGAKALIHTEVQARYTPIVIFHAAVMLAWLALFANQASLAAWKRFSVHKALGRASIILVAAMVVSGVIISWNIGQELGRFEVTIVNVAAFVTFVPLYVAGIHFARQRRIHPHRQAMLIGTLALMTPAYARVIQVIGLPDPVAIAVQLPITVLMTLSYEWLTMRRLTREVRDMLIYSVAVIVVMVAVLAVFFV
ncbi:hypothetical protein IB285_09635 [Erythrobacter sp. KMU-140]|uniref:Uncharacterized protein n=1 Tax=Erythrobacter rubeus TaxID=2760803 RepID=A0ABR8KWD1_9SPHN|nr:hypothetical protein [Erythrobacter rubeus]